MNSCQSSWLYCYCWFIHLIEVGLLREEQRNMNILQTKLTTPCEPWGSGLSCSEVQTESKTNAEQLSYALWRRSYTSDQPNKRTFTALLWYCGKWPYMESLWVFSTAPILSFAQLEPRTYHNLAHSLLDHLYIIQYQQPHQRFGRHLV